MKFINFSRFQLFLKKLDLAFLQINKMTSSRSQSGKRKAMQVFKNVDSEPITLPIELALKRLDIGADAIETIGRYWN